VHLDQNSDSESCSVPSIPVELRAFANRPAVLPGENVEELEMVQRMMIEEVRPETNMEWLWTLDLIELSWEILRYRRLKQRVLKDCRQSAIAAILLRLDGAGIQARDFQHLEFQIGRSAAEWRDNPQAAADIEARLRRHGFDDTAVDAEVFYQARVLFGMFDDLMHGAQARRMVLLREITSRRELSKRPTKARSRADAGATQLLNSH
jgi:hypothetical protein